ncbi:hypothetical protein LTR56_022639 [Elasticomyces elasticus]|nr:hypothetical protein LTR22_026073 [Elasticomyces elasticus]KAK3621672.1 hypothetical protein LTR56_022639 [Elasticomyces elasticus]KAK4921884.1 hypothetical protein LTR49_010657 [Elasticomyces elasticus]KAK5740061.1 hypothetical protein LTS12_025070 [Elasticomyces elasticus]
MGIIKTAMMSGVAIYGVKQLSHVAAERRPASAPSNGNRRDMQYERDLQYESSAPYQQYRRQLPPQESTFYEEEYSRPAPPPPQRCQQQQRTLDQHPAQAGGAAAYYHSDGKQPAYDQRQPQYAYQNNGNQQQPQNPFQNDGYQPGPSQQQEYRRMVPDCDPQPPTYARSQDGQRGFVEPDEQYESDFGNSSGGHRDALFSQAANFLQSRGGRGGEGSRSRPVRELLGGLMNK